MWVCMITCLVFVFQFVVKGSGTAHDSAISLSNLMDDADKGKVAEITVNGTEVTGKYRDSKEQFHTTIPANYPDMYKVLREKGVNITVKDQNNNAWFAILLQIAPFALILGIMIFFLRQMQSGGNKAMSFGKSRARLLSLQQKKVTFKDVAGVDEAKEELKEIIEFLRESAKFQRLGGRIPKGVLLVGPPGTGKTLLARAVAGEANVPFFSISGSDFVEMFVGVGASRVRDLFEQGKKNAPCIIF